MDQPDTRGNLVRALIYGSPKSRKTWWAMRMAEAGFNVILADLDDGAGIIQALDPAARKRIFRLDMRPNAESMATSGAAALAYAMSGQIVYFDEETRSYVPVQKLDPDREYARLDFMKATSHDLFCLDTWSAFVQQMTFNTVFVKTPIQIDKLEWDDYGKVRLILDNFLGNMMKLSCHAVIVAHAENYAKKKQDVDPKGKQMHEIIDTVRLQPTSVSRGHAETMAGKFNEVLYFENKGKLLGTRISTTGTDDFDAGSRYFAPGDYKFDDLGPAGLVTPELLAEVRALGDHDFNSPAVTMVRGADVLAERAAANAKPATVNVKPGETVSVTSRFKKT
jgi:hypothetical protein